MRFTKLFWVDHSVGLALVSLLFLLMSTGVQAQSFIKVSGSVIDKETKAPVPYVHIYTRSYENGTTTDEQGHFSIIIDRTDTLIFSSVGFDKYRLVLKNIDSRSVYHVIIEMDSKTYELEPVVVNALMSFDEFKKQVLDLNMPTQKEEFSLNIPPGYKLPPEAGDDKILNPSVKVTGPVSALYNLFSKEGKQGNKLEELRRNRRNELIIESKYNLEIIKKVTQLKEDDAKRFMEWCKFEDDYILQTSDYDLAVAMLRCLDEFHKTDSIR